MSLDLRRIPYGNYLNFGGVTLTLPCRSKFKETGLCGARRWSPVISRDQLRSPKVNILVRKKPLVFGAPHCGCWQRRICLPRLSLTSGGRYANGDRNRCCHGHGDIGSDLCSVGFGGHPFARFLRTKRIGCRQKRNWAGERRP